MREVGRVAGGDPSGRGPQQRGRDHDVDAGPRRVAPGAGQPAGEGRADRGAAQRGDVGGLGRVHEVAGGIEAARPCSARRRRRSGTSTRRRARRRLTRASSWSGIQSPVKTTVSTATVRRVSVAAVVQLDRRGPGRGRGSRAPRCRSTAAPARPRRVAPANGPYDWWRGWSVTIATVCTPADRSVSTAEYDTCSAPTTSARCPTGRCCRWTHCWSWPVVKIALRRGRPGRAGPNAVVHAPRSPARPRRRTRCARRWARSA